MPRFFAREEFLQNGRIVVTGSDAHHIGYSLRMKTGDNIVFVHGGTEYDTVITEMTADTVICDIRGQTPSDCEPTVFLTLYQALPKGDKMELIIQKTSELGVSRIVPFISARCVSRPDSKSAEKKVARWQRIAEEAAKQAGRGIIPEISKIMNFEEALADMESSELMLFCYENGSSSIAEAGICADKSIAVMIGAEGGFERSEAHRAAERGAIPLWLGKRILRCETCPIAVTAVIMNLSGNF